SFCFFFIFTVHETGKGTVWMVNALSRYLRMSINKGEAIVPLSDELDLTRTYLGIMQKRFSHQFEVEYDLDQAAMECLIPKLSLQPLVENALLHGILYCDKTEKRLVIRAWRSSRAFGVEIEDNGNGMAPETAQKLTELDIRTSKSYGVANVHKRLDIFGQGKCKFYISAREGIGTCVMIELPVQPHDSD
ncbi:MAG: sensor histidine kinase, partial [Ruthenibacterium lactatiformans]